MQEPFSDLDIGWSWVVMLACFATSFVIGGTGYNAGIIHTILLEMYGENQATTSLAGALHGSITCLAAPLCIMVIDRFSTRTALIVSGVLYTIGFFSTAFSPSIRVSIFTYGVISGFGAALGLSSSMVATGFHFRRYRNIVQGFVVSGNGVGMFGMAPLMQLAVDVFGNVGFFILLACASMHLIVFGTVTIPSQLEIYTQKKRLEEFKQKTPSSQSSGLLYAYFKVFTTKSITCLSLSCFMYCWGMYAVIMFLPKYCVHQGVSHMQASLVLSACGAASIFGRIVTGIVGSYDKVNEVILFSSSIGLLALATALFPFFSKEFSGQIAYGIMFGLFFGNPWAIIMAINISYVGVSKMTAALGIELCLGGIGGIFGPVIGGLILDSGGTYEHVFLMAGVSLFIAATLGLVSLVFAKRNNDEDQSATFMDKDQSATFMDKDQSATFMDKDQSTIFIKGASASQKMIQCPNQE